MQFFAVFTFQSHSSALTMGVNKPWHAVAIATAQNPSTSPAQSLGPFRGACRDRTPPAGGVSHYRPLVIRHDDAPPVQPNGEPLKVPVVAGADPEQLTCGPTECHRFSRPPIARNRHGIDHHPRQFAPRSSFQGGGNRSSLRRALARSSGSPKFSTAGAVAGAVVAPSAITDAATAATPFATPSCTLGLIR